MATIRTFTQAFNGGELTPEFFGRIGDAKYQSGVALMRNFIAFPHGPAANRPGFGFVREVKDSTKRVQLIPFIYSTTQSMVIEVGAGYFRFHTNGATLLYATPAAYSAVTNYFVGDMVSYLGLNYYCVFQATGIVPTNGMYWYPLPASLIYEIPNPYAESALADIHYVQSSDVMTLVHPLYQPMELKRMGATKWVLAPIIFVSTLIAPTGLTVTPSAVDTTYTYSYQITTVGTDGIDESLANTAVSCTNNLFTTGNYNTIDWTAATGTPVYRVYKQSNGSGLYGYIGQTTGVTFRDDNIAPDTGKTPPISNNPFSGAGEYPGAVSYFEQRRCFAGSVNKPQNVWLTKTGTESNMNYSIPTKDDDYIGFKVSSREANTVRHVVPLTNLVLLTSSTEWRVTSSSDALTPATINVRPQSYIGANNVTPVIVNNNLIYNCARGGHVREMSYNWQANGYITGDLSLRAPHLFDGLNILDMAYAKSPQPICWFVSSNGKLLGLTYVPEQIGAWHQHDTDGLFESITVVPEGDEDVLYAVIQRTIGGVAKRYIERLHTRFFAQPADAFFVDSGLTYSGAATTTLSGLTHLEGKTVSILCDGDVHPPRVVTGGAVLLDNATTKAQIGLPIQADIQTMPIAAQTDSGYAQGHAKNVNKAWLRVYRSGGISVGADAGKLVQYKQRSNEPYGTPPALKTDELEIVLSPSWGQSGQILVRQNDPMPLTLVSLTLEVAVGG